MNITKSVSIKKIKLVKKAALPKEPIDADIITPPEIVAPPVEAPTPPEIVAPPVEAPTPPKMKLAERPVDAPPPNMRCIAICDDNQQCMRVKKRGCLLCTMHAKTMATQGEDATPKMLAIEVWVEEINGIVYYFDKKGNVYDTEDVLENRQNPRIIGRHSIASQNIPLVERGGWGGEVPKAPRPPNISIEFI